MTKIYTYFQQVIIPGGQDGEGLNRMYAIILVKSSGRKSILWEKKGSNKISGMT